MAKKVPPSEPENSETGEAPELEKSTEFDKIAEPEPKEEVIEDKACPEAPEAPVDYYTQLRECATILANKLDADVIIYSGYIETPYD
ncbi:MAG: hypothetical protein WCF59_09530 [Desulfobaccales bacterium]